MKLLVNVCFCFWSLFLLGQQPPILRFQFDDNNGDAVVDKETFTLTNSQNNNLAFAIQEKKKAYGLLIDDQFNVISHFSQEDVLSPRFANIIGYNYNNEAYVLIGKHNSNGRKFAEIKFDYKNKKVVTTEFKFEFNNQQYISTIQHKDQLILLTVDSENNIILWKYNNQLGFNQVASFPIPIEGKKQNLYYTLFGKNKVVAKIDNRVPMGLELTGKNIKLYPIKDHVILTFDHKRDTATTLHDIDLNNLSLETQKFSYPKAPRKDFKRFNSYLLTDQTIAQIAVNLNGLKLELKNREGIIQKKYSIYINGPITFANSPLYQDGSTYSDGLRELKSNEQFLRKLTNGNVGLTGYYTYGEYRLSIGGYKDLVGLPMVMPGFSNTTSLGGTMTLEFNPIYAGYNYSLNTAAVYFNTSLDSQLEHIDKDKEELNIFEKANLLKRGDNYTTAKDVFAFQSDFYFFYYDQQKNTFYLHKLE